MMFYANFSASGLTDDDTDDIQWMPPGVQTVSPHTPEGKVVTVTILVDEAAAERVEECRARYQAEFDAGTGDAPYIDFLHADGEASAWVNRVYWGGDDPKTGGIRLVVSWTDEGRAKKGKSLKRFSPSFDLSEPDGDGICTVTGTSANMGGLVNRAAFRAIQSLSASAPAGGGPENTKTETTTMTDEEIKALQDENATLKKQLEETQKIVSDMQAKAAEDSVEAACAEGKISPDMKASWKETLLKNPDAKKLLASLPVNPVFQAAYKPEDNKDGNPQGQALLASYDAIKDPAARTAFFAKHRKELLSSKH